MKRFGKFLYYILAGGVALFAVGYLIYEIVYQNIFNVSNLIRTLVIVATMILAIYRVASGKGKRTKKHSPQFFRDHYGDHIGNAFSIPTKESKQFFSALEYYQADQPAKLVDAMRKLESLCKNHDERFAVFFFKALGYSEMHAYEKSAEAYEKALLYRDSSTAASNLGLCYQRLALYDKAIDAYRLAIRLDSHNAYPYANLAQLYLKTENYDQASQYADLALERQGNLYQVYSVKALVCGLRGDTAGFEKASRQYALYGGDRETLLNLARNMNINV